MQISKNSTVKKPVELTNYALYKYHIFPPNTVSYAAINEYFVETSLKYPPIKIIPLYKRRELAYPNSDIVYDYNKLKELPLKAYL